MRTFAFWCPIVLLGVVALDAEAHAEVTSTRSTTDPTLLEAVLSQAEWIDLTYPFDEDTIYWPTANNFHLGRGPAGLTEKGYYYSANDFSAAEHGGTHIDAPVHFFEGGDSVDEIPLRRLVGAAVVVDLTRQCASDPDYQIVEADLVAWEKEHGRSLTDRLVLLRTGWGKFWPDRAQYLGTAERGTEAVAKLHFPGLHPDAARWLIEQRSIRAVGIDTASIDYGQSQLFQSHVALFEHGVPAFENVANLDKLPADGVLVIALPMKIGNGSGGPLRIIATVPSEEDRSDAGALAE